MPPFVLKDPGLLVDELSIAGDMNQVAYGLEAEEKDDTVFGDLARTRAAGTLLVVTASASGFLNFDSLGADLDTFMDGKLGGGLFSFTGVPEGLAENAVAHLLRLSEVSLNRMGANVGDMAPFAFAGAGAGGVPAIKGHLAGYEAAQATASGQSTGIQEGAIVAPALGYAQLHLLAISGSTFDIDLQSDTAGFGTPTVRHGFTQLTAPGSEFAIIPATADDWWRIDWTIGGGATVTFAVFFGIR